MARIRTIKPDFWTDEKIGKISIPARLLFIGTWNFSDDSGQLRWTPAYIKAQIFAYNEEISLAMVRTWMAELEQIGVVEPYRSESDESLAIVKKFLKHQVINKPSKIRLPGPHLNGSSRTTVPLR